MLVAFLIQQQRSWKNAEYNREVGKTQRQNEQRSSKNAKELFMGTTEEKNLETKVEETKVEGSGATNTDNNETKPTEQKTTETKPADDKTEEKLSVDEQLAQMRLENAKQKRALDKAMAEASSYKKQLREKQTVEEIKAQEKAEQEALREEKFKELEKKVAVNELEKKYLTLGYPEEKAQQSAIAQYEGDTETLFAIQEEMQEFIKKETKAEIIASNPEINSGEGEEKEKDAFLEGFNSVD